MQTKLAQGRPIIHKLDDPTGIAGLRGRTLRAMKKQCRLSEADVKAFVRNVFDRHLVGIETNATTYVYEYSPDAAAITNRQIKSLIYRHMLGTNEPIWSLQWWMNSYLKQSFDRGARDSLQSAKNLSPASIVGPELSQEIRSTEVDQVLQQPYYRRRLEAAYGRTFNEMVGFSDTTAKQVSGILGRAITSGVNYRAVAKEFNKVFDDMAGYRSERIVRTEMNKINNDAYTDNTKQLNATIYNDSAYEVAVMHLSALTPTTRNSHAFRHGRVYTPEEQNEWWDSGSNRIQCLCSVTDVLRHKKTGEVLQTALHKKALEQGKKFFASK